MPEWVGFGHVEGIIGSGEHVVGTENIDQRRKLMRGEHDTVDERLFKIVRRRMGKIGAAIRTSAPGMVNAAGIVPACPARCLRWSPYVWSPVHAGTRIGAASSAVWGLRLVWRSLLRLITHRQDFAEPGDRISGRWGRPSVRKICGTERIFASAKMEDFDPVYWQVSRRLFRQLPCPPNPWPPPRPQRRSLGFWRGQRHSHSRSPVSLMRRSRPSTCASRLDMSQRRCALPRSLLGTLRANRDQLDAEPITPKGARSLTSKLSIVR